MKDPGESLLAMSPPVSAPSPIPRFITTRCVAKAGGRCSGGVRPAMRVDCDGQKPPTPIPLTTATTNPCHGSWTSAYAAKPTVKIASESASIAFPPKRSICEPKIGPATMLATACVATTRPATPSDMPRTLWR